MHRVLRVIEEHAWRRGGVIEVSELTALLEGERVSTRAALRHLCAAGRGDVVGTVLHLATPAPRLARRLH